MKTSKKARDIVFNVIVTSRFAYLRKDVTFFIEEVCVAERLAIRLRQSLRSGRPIRKGVPE